MTDADDTIEPAADNDEEYVLVHQPKDWILETLVEILAGELDDSESTWSLTIQSNGATISGTAISAHAYFNAIAQQFEQAGTPEFRGAVDVWRDALAKSYAHKERRKAKGLPVDARRFIHMKDTTILTGSQSIEMPLWRGTLDDVTGWSIGKIKPGDA